MPALALCVAAGPAVSVGLPSPGDWEAALHPRAVEPAPDHVATTGVDAGTFTATTRWPGSEASPPAGAATGAGRSQTCQGALFGAHAHMADRSAPFPTAAQRRAQPEAWAAHHAACSDTLAAPTSQPA